ncbi:MAG: LysM peptidoglycan-binding domain-containing protein [Chromatiales bacterium]|nr:LysM peptidoglycan-binding domain-containing protein [Chromatiales bacterium]
MRRLRQPVRTANSLLRLAIRRVPAAPALTSSLLLGLAPAGHALTLGDISVRSALGQRLDATVPVRLGAGETLASTCVAPVQQGADLGRVPGARVASPQAAREGAYELRVTSDAALYEPMYELELKVQCPGAPMVVRQYVLMLDLPAAVAASTAEAAAPGVVPVPAPQGATPLTTAAEAAPARLRPGARTPAGKIEAGSRYRVATGDTLSGLAARVAGRQVSLQAMADAIQAANPEAFIRNDANLIKLGSEITIPLMTAAAPAPGPMALPTDVPAPTLPQALDAVPPVPVAAPAAEAALPAPAEAAALAEFPEATPPPPVIAVEPVRATPARLPNPAPDEAAASATDEPNPFVAAGAGIVFGLLVSAFLWFRGRLPSRRRRAPDVQGQADDPSLLATTALAATPAPLVTREAEPGFSVSFTPAHDDALAAEFADDPGPEYAPPPRKVARHAGPLSPPPGEDITSELEELFDGTDTTIQKRLNAEKTVAARAFYPDHEDEARATGSDGEVDFPVGDPTGEEELLGANTVDQPRPNLEATAQSPTVDLRTLAAAATRDQQQAQTLLEALTLLERDYEEELTASQVLDMSAMREALGNELDEPTQVSEAGLREAPARKKSR